MRFIAVFSGVVLAACGGPVEETCASGETCNALLVASRDAGTVVPAGSCPAAKPTTKCLYDVGYDCHYSPSQGWHWECQPTPLVLAFDVEPVLFTSRAARFDLTGSGEPVSSDWPTAATPWLALDRNHDGTINDATELVRQRRAIEERRTGAQRLRGARRARRQP